MVWVLESCKNSIIFLLYIAQIASFKDKNAMISQAIIDLLEFFDWIIKVTYKG